MMPVNYAFKRFPGITETNYFFQLLLAVKNRFIFDKTASDFQIIINNNNSNSQS